MKRLYKILLLSLFIPLWTACSDEEAPYNSDERVSLDGLAVRIADRGVHVDDNGTRAIRDFVVNTANDPTYDITRLTGQKSWKLDVVVYDHSSTVYLPASGTWTYQSTPGYWIPDQTLYLPNYLKPRLEATLYPGTVDAAIDPDQSTADRLFTQDILVQKSEPYTIDPAHVLAVELRHKHAMIDFILQDVNMNDIAEIVVELNGKTYFPYQARTNEYLLVIPEGSSGPRVKITTKEGARYSAMLTVANAQRNNCYCVKLTGVELLLSTVTVVDWAYGTALSGQYTTPASYPTFRGRPGLTVTLEYDNGLAQEITFNERGESTVKPYGRTIVKVGDTMLVPPIVLNEMYVDLLPYLPV